MINTFDTYCIGTEDLEAARSTLPNACLRANSRTRTGAAGTRDSFMEISMTRSALLCLTLLAGMASCGFPRPALLDDGGAGSDAGPPSDGPATDGSPGDGSSGPPAVNLTLLAGDIGGTGNADGTGITARFAFPFGVAVDGSGNVYVADFNNGAIRKITSSGVVTTLAGPAAGFSLPQGVAVDGNGNVYVADENNNTISKISATGVVTQIVGAGVLDEPASVAVDAASSVYIADTGNNAIRKVTSGGVITTLAGADAQLNSPTGVAVDGAGNVYVADSGNSVVRKITPGGTVSTLAGTVGSAGSADGTGAAARFFGPAGVAVDSAGNVYIADTGNNTIRKVTPVGVVTTVAGVPGTSGSTNGTGTAARFSGPAGVAVDSAGNVYVAEVSNDTIRRIAPSGAVTTLAGKGPEPGSADGAGGSARFNSPSGVAVDRTGNFYVADTNNDTIRKITPTGMVTTFAGTAGSSGSADGEGTDARFFGARGVAVDSSGIISVADTVNCTIRQVTAAGVVTTVAGSARTNGSTDGTGMAATFDDPYAVAVDGAGNIYVVDFGNSAIRRVTAAGAVTTIAGTAGMPGSLDGIGTAALFFLPQGIAVDSASNVYVADSDNFTIRKITPAGLVTTLAGSARSRGSADGTGATARFSFPQGLAVDSSGNVYVADTFNSTIRKVSPGGVVTTIAGTTGSSGIVLGVKPGLASPTSLAVVGDSLVITDTNAILLLEHVVK